MYDAQLKKIDFYQRYPSCLPFIGSNYPNSKQRVLLLGESHYMSNELGKEISQTWYDENEKSLELKIKKFNLNNKDKKVQVNWISPRQVINSFQKKPGHKPFRIFLNTAQVLERYFETDKSKQAIEIISFYNYFLRPAEKKGLSIHQNKLDRFHAYNNLNLVVDIIKPHKIIFISRLAYQAFKTSHSQQNDVFPFTSWTPHPSSSWWNRKSKKYSFNESEALSGRERFEAILDYSIHNLNKAD